MLEYLLTYVCRGSLELRLTLRLYEGLEFETRLASGNDYLKRDY